jgi:hypothetical protein
MEIETPFDDQDRQRLRRAMGGDRDYDDLAQLIALAGAREAIDQATGRFVPSTIAEERSYRIFCLLREGLSLADAYALIAGIFQTEPATAKRYVDSAMARFRVELDEAMDAAIRAAFADDAAGTEFMDSLWWVRVPDSLIGRVRQIVHDAGQPEIASARKGNVWKFADESYQAVRAAVALTVRPLPKKR